MKLILALALLLSSAPAADWRYEAVICGNIMTGEEGIPRAKMQVRREGCWDAKVEHLFEDRYLVYGVKIERPSY